MARKKLIAVNRITLHHGISTVCAEYCDKSSMSGRYPSGRGTYTAANSYGKRDNEQREVPPLRDLLVDLHRCKGVCRVSIRSQTCTQYTTFVVRVVNFLTAPKELHLAERCQERRTPSAPARPRSRATAKHTLLEVAPVPQQHVHNRRTQAEVVAHLADRVRRREPRQADLGQLLGVELVARREDCALVVRPAVRAEQRTGHPDEVAPVEDVMVVRQREHEVPNSHSDWLCAL